MLVQAYPSDVLVTKSGMPGALAAGGGSKAPRGLLGKEDVGNIANAPHVLSASINVPASVPAHKLWAAEFICAAKVCWTVPLQPWNHIAVVRGALDTCECYKMLQVAQARYIQSQHVHRHSMALRVFIR